MGLSSFKFVQWAPKYECILQERAGWKRILTSNSHSRRSFKVIQFAVSYWPTRGSISPYNIAGLISEDSEATQIAKNCRRQQSHSHLTPPPRGTPANISIHPATGIIGLHFVADSMGLSSFTFVQWAPKDASFLQRSVFWPFKVIQGRWFWYQSIGTVVRCEYGPILHRFWDTATYWLKIAYFSYPSVIQRPYSLCFLWNFAPKLTTRKLESWGYPLVKTALVAGVVLTQCQRVTQGQTDGRIYHS